MTPKKLTKTEAEEKKKAESEKKAAYRARQNQRNLEQLSSLLILYLVSNNDSMPFHVATKNERLSEKHSPDHSETFGQWFLDNPSLHHDALAANGSEYPIVKISREDDESLKHMVLKFNSPAPYIAYCVAQKLAGMSGNQTPQPQQIGFTRIDYFLEQIKQRNEQLRK